MVYGHFYKHMIHFRGQIVCKIHTRTGESLCIIHWFWAIPHSLINLSTFKNLGHSHSLMSWTFNWYWHRDRYCLYINPANHRKDAKNPSSPFMINNSRIKNTINYTNLKWCEPLIFSEACNHISTTKCLMNLLSRLSFHIYLVVEPTHLEKYARQIGSFPQGSGWK